jgi:tRNA (guanine37-N1)-methyltransferase
VSQVGSIVSKFRTFDLEVLAGDSNLDVELIESGITFKFTYGAVYWNSKLQHEHARVLELLQPGDFVVDLFAGVGPFAVPAAKHRGCTVVANDLNPRSAEALEAAAWGCDLPVAKLTETRIESSAPPSSPMRKKLRRRRSGEKSRKGRLEGAVDPSSSRSTRPKLQEVSESCAKLAPFLPTTSSVTVGNLDAAACVAACAALAFDGDSASGRSGPRAPDHVLMNLPAMAVSFLHALAPWRPLISSPEASETREGTSSSGVRQVAATHSTRVHCYTFSTAEDPGPDAVAQVERGLGDIMPGELDAIGCLAYVHLVRSTAPGKTMVCVGFDLPPIKPKN